MCLIIIIVIIIIASLSGGKSRGRISSNISSTRISTKTALVLILVEVVVVVVVVVVVIYSRPNSYRPTLHVADMRITCACGTHSATDTQDYLSTRSTADCHIIRVRLLRMCIILLYMTSLEQVVSENAVARRRVEPLGIRAARLEIAFRSSL